MKDIALKSIMIMPNLLLQKSSQNSKGKDHLKALQRRLESWISGDLLKLLKAETIRNSLRSRQNIAEISKTFSQETKKGNANSAIKIVTDNMKNGILPLTRQILNQLKLNYPEEKESSQEMFLADTPETTHPVKFERIIIIIIITLFKADRNTNVIQVTSNKIADISIEKR